MSELKTNLQEILQEKQDKIIPGNIKKDVQIFDVIGTYEGSVKLFETVANMQDDNNAQNGDLAIVYGNVITELTAKSEFQIALFPEVVTLEQAVTTEKRLSLEVISGAAHPSEQGFGYLTSSLCNIGLLMSGDLVQYTSNDGITYTRQSITGDKVGENGLDFGCILKVTNEDSYDSVFSNFIKLSIMEFDGLYEYNGEQYTLASTQFTATSDYVYDKDFYGKNGYETGSLGSQASSDFDDMTVVIYTQLQKLYDNMEVRILTDSDKTIADDLITIPTKSDGTLLIDFSQLTNGSQLFEDHNNILRLPYLNTDNLINAQAMFRRTGDKFQEFSGLNLSNVENASQMFYMSKITSLNFNFDLPNATNVDSMFGQCNSLTEVGTINIPKATVATSMFFNSNLVTINITNTNELENIKQMFYSCNNLVNLSEMNWMSVTNMQSVVGDCGSLSNESLNNILASLLTATSYTGTKTLQYIGLNQTQATTCASLSNWSACEAAGWTTGY